MTEHLFFAIINAEKGIVTRCVENGRSQRKKRSFYGKNISDRKAFPSGCAFRRSWSFRRIWKKFAVEKESTDYTYTITIVDILPEAEGELLVNRVDLQVFRNGEGLESRLIGVKGEERPICTVS